MNLKKIEKIQILLQENSSLLYETYGGSLRFFEGIFFDSFKNKWFLVGLDFNEICNMEEIENIKNIYTSKARLEDGRITYFEEKGQLIYSFYIE